MYDTPSAADDGSPEALPCPRCARDMEIVDQGGIEFDRCTTCRGLLIERATLVPMLTALTRALPEDFDIEDAIEPVSDDRPSLSCPDCSEPMVRFGYLGTRTIILDRCDRCHLRWIDGDELLAMVALHAQTEGRQQKRVRQLEEWERSLSRLVFVKHMTGARNLSLKSSTRKVIRQMHTLEPRDDER